MLGVYIRLQAGKRSSSRATIQIPNTLERHGHPRKCRHCKHLLPRYVSFIVQQYFCALSSHRPHSDNKKRSERVQQLVESINGLQNDIKAIGVQLEEKSHEYKDGIDAMLKAHGMNGVDDVIAKAASQMTPQDQKEFQTVRCSDFS